jgi:hypothetical protein
VVEGDTGRQCNIIRRLMVTFVNCLFSLVIGSFPVAFEHLHRCSQWEIDNRVALISMIYVLKFTLTKQEVT